MLGSWLLAQLTHYQAAAFVNRFGEGHGLRKMGRAWQHSSCKRVVTGHKQQTTLIDLLIMLHTCVVYLAFMTVIVTWLDLVFSNHLF